MYIYICIFYGKKNGLGRWLRYLCVFTVDVLLTFASKFDRRNVDLMHGV